MPQKKIKIIESKSISNCSSDTPSKNCQFNKNELEIGKFMFQYHKGKQPTIFSKCFSKLYQKHKYETRLSNTKNYFLPSLILKRPRSN